MISDILKRTSVVQAIVPVAITSAATAVDADLSDWESALCILELGTQAGTSSTFKIQHADDDGAGSPDTYADVPDAQLTGGANFAAVTTANDITTLVRGYIGTKKWLTIDLTANTNGNIVAGATIVRANGRHLT